MANKYILDKNNIPVLEPDLVTWARWFESNTEQMIVETTTINTIQIMTHFLAIDFNFTGEGNPILYETLITGLDTSLSSLPERSRMYTTRDEAAKGHKQMCEMVEVCIAKLAMEENDAQNQQA